MGVKKINSRQTSVSVAKDRLRNLLISDRVNCTPDSFEKMKKDLYRTLSKYMEIKENVFEVRITRNQIYIELTGENS
jgi:cell division topological specificity factor